MTIPSVFYRTLWFSVEVFYCSYHRKERRLENVSIGKQLNVTPPEKGQSSSQRENMQLPQHLKYLNIYCIKCLHFTVRYKVPAPPPSPRHSSLVGPNFDLLVLRVLIGRQPTLRKYFCYSGNKIVPNPTSLCHWL